MWKKIFGERKDIFLEEKKNGEGRGGKYLERENVTMVGQTTNKERSSYSSNGRWKAEMTKKGMGWIEMETDSFGGRRKEKGGEFLF